MCTMSKLSTPPEGSSDTGNRSMSEYVTSHDSILNCPICMDIYKTPRMLPCQHTLCDPCLRAYLINKNHSRVLVMDFPCPVCRASTPAPKTYKPLEEWAGFFPLNHIVVSLLDGRGKMILEAINKQQEVNTTNNDKDTCPQHPGKEVDFFCADHALPICGKCFKNKHRHCNVNDIEDQMEFQTRYAAVSTDIDKAQSYLEDVMQVIKSNTTEITKQRDVYFTEVQEFIGKIELFLQKFKQEATSKLNTTHEQLQDTLLEQHGRLGRLKEAVTHTEKTLKKAGTSTNMVQSLKELAKVETELKKHFSTMKVNHEDIHTFGLEFKLCGKLDPFLASLEQLSKPKVEVITSTDNITDHPTLSIPNVDESQSDGDDEFSANRRDTNKTSVSNDDKGTHSRQDAHLQTTQPSVERRVGSINTPAGDDDTVQGPTARTESRRTRAVSDAYIDYTEDTSNQTIQQQQTAAPGRTSHFARQMSQPVIMERQSESARQTSERSGVSFNNFSASSTGTDNTREGNEPSPRVTNVTRSLKDRRAVKIQDINTRISSDNKECNITGSTSLPDRRLILVDCNNSKIKLFSKELKAQGYLDFDCEPWNVVATSPHEIAVTVPLEKAIHIVRIQGGLLTDVRRIDTRKECWGIAHLDGKLVVTAKDDGSWVLFLDKTGRELMSVNFASKDNPSILRPVSITTAPSGQVMYVSCEGQSGTKGALVTLTPSGEVKNVYTNWSLDKPYSSTVDREGNVYVHGMRSSNVHLVSPAGERIKMLLTTQDSISRPQHICFLPGTDTFLLTERRLDTGSIFEMK